MEEVKTSKRKIEEKDNNNDDGMTKKQKTVQQEIDQKEQDQKEQEGTVVFSKFALAAEEARELLEEKSRYSWLIHESKTEEGLMVVDYLQKDENHQLKRVSMRYMLTQKGWEGCPVEKDKLAEAKKRMIPLNCTNAEEHFESFQKKASNKFNLKYLVEPTETQRSPNEAYRSYTKTFFLSSSKPQEKKQPEKTNEKISDEEMSDVLKMSPK